MMLRCEEALNCHFDANLDATLNVVCFSLWSGWFCASVPAASVREPRFSPVQSFIPVQANACQNAFYVGSDRAWHSVRVCPCGKESRPAKRSIPFGCGDQTHRVAEDLQTLAQELQAAERHITDRDMGPDALWGPVIDGPDLEILVVAAEAGFDFSELVQSGCGPVWFL